MWYKLAIENGGNSYYKLGECYAKGIGVEINRNMAIKMYKKAVAYDDHFALRAKQRSIVPFVELQIAKASEFCL